MMNRLIFCFLSSLCILCGTLKATTTALTTSYSILNDWGTGSVVSVNITNPSSTAVSSWTANFSLPQGQVINCLWNGMYTQNTQTVSVTNSAVDGTIEPGQTISFGFQIANPNMLANTLSNLSASGISSSPENLTFNASYAVDTVWATAFHAIVTLTNNTSTAITSWISTFTLPPSYVLSTYLNGGNFSVNGQTVTVTNLSSNGSIQPGASVTYNMIIDMPSGAKTVINNLQAFANGTPPTPPATLTPPVLQSISNPNDASQYTVQWNSVSGATGYNLLESQSTDFTHAVVVYSGVNTSAQISGKANGTYYYEVVATAGSVTSNPSNAESTTVEQTMPPPPTTLGIEHSVWYIDWTSWFTGPTFVLPTGVDTINVFVGELNFAADGTPTLDGFGNFSLAQLAEFAAYCRSQNPSISVKVSIGGSGGMYDNCWDRLTTSNVQAFAQGIANFCQQYGLDGVDFDYEEYASTAQETLVGTLIKNVKTINPALKTSLCTNAGFGPNFPWQAVVQTILDAAMIAPGNCAVDRLYVMTYYDPIQSEENWLVGTDGNGGWVNWVIQNYGFTRARVSVGIDDFDAHAYDPVAFANWAATQGLSTAHWAFDPAHPSPNP